MALVGEDRSYLCAFRILSWPVGTFKVPFSSRGAISTESVRLCLVKYNNFLLPFLLESSWCGVITDSTYVQQAVLVSLLIVLFRFCNLVARCLNFFDPFCVFLNSRSRFDASYG